MIQFSLEDMLGNAKNVFALATGHGEGFCQYFGCIDDISACHKLDPMGRLSLLAPHNVLWDNLVEFSLTERKDVNLSVCGQWMAGLKL